MQYSPRLTCLNRENNFWDSIESSLTELFLKFLLGFLSPAFLTAGRPIMQAQLSELGFPNHGLFLTPEVLVSTVVQIIHSQWNW